jgi:putative ABC transport system substrate-binding protein
MNRRAVILGLPLIATIPRVQAQQQARVHRIAIVSPSAPVGDMTETGNRRYGAFFQRLRQLGYLEGQNLVVERYSGEGRTEQFAELAATVVRSKPDLILLSAVPLALAIKAITEKIPVVALVADAVAFGLVPSLAHPGGNITGVSMEPGVAMMGKRLEVFHEMVPTASRIAWLASPRWWESPDAAALLEAAQRIKIAVVRLPFGAPFEQEQYRRVFAAMEQEGLDGLMVNGQPENITNRRLIVALAEKARLPAIYSYRDFTDVGGLVSYGPDLSEVLLLAAEQIDQILKGAKPGDIPFYQPTKWELVVNLKTAKALGIEVPGSLLARADEVIE